jgi:hypothetical protein
MGWRPRQLGYAYQTEWCLVELLRRAPDQPDMAISLELHDDVAWEQAGSPTELLQLKHKIRSSGALTDQHDDLWSTIRVWMNCPEHGHAPDAEPSPRRSCSRRGHRRAQ